MWFGRESSDVDHGYEIEKVEAWFTMMSMRTS